MASRKGSGPTWATMCGAESMSEGVRRGTQGPQPVMRPELRRSWMVDLSIPENIDMALKA